MRRPLALLAPLALVAAACGPRTTSTVVATPVPVTMDPLPHAVVPAPAEISVDKAQRFVVDSTTRVVVRPDAPDAVKQVGGWLASVVSQDRRPEALRATEVAAGAPAPRRAILLVLDESRTALGDEGYELAVDSTGATLTARRPAGLFYAGQTLRQLLTPAIEHQAAFQRRAWAPAARVTDVPRFAWRGFMLDVSRHFLPPADVKRFIDNVALYKVNRLHLHLSDDQGWRVMIDSWPDLARIGGSTQVGGGPGGHYTKAELADLVAYARARFIEVVPEFDMPGHTNAALASYPNLNCNGQAPALYTGIRVGFSALCVGKDSTYQFVEDVVREVGAITGPWFHIGGDEVEKLTHDQYLRFIERVEGIVRRHGKVMIGWGEVSPAKLDPTSIVQHWRRDSSAVHAARGGKVILSPGSRLYVDMKYDSTTTLGLRWAGLVPLRTAYDWDPATQLPGIGEASILGVEAPLWSETLVRREDYESMAFPRLLALAEVAWSRQAARDWDGFARRVGAHGPRMAALGINFARVTGVHW